MKFVLSLIFLLSANFVGAQIGFEFGTGYGQLSFLQTENAPNKTDLEEFSFGGEPLIKFGFFYKMKIAYPLNIQIGLSYKSLGSNHIWNQRLAATESIDSTTFRSNYSSYRLNSLELPILLEHSKYNFAFGFVFSRTLAIRNESFTDETIVFKSQKVSERTYFSGYEGGGSFLPFLRNYNAKLQISYSYPFREFLHFDIYAGQSLLPIFKGDEIPWANFRTSEMGASLKFFVN